MSSLFSTMFGSTATHDVEVVAKEAEVIAKNVEVYAKEAEVIADKVEVYAKEAEDVATNVEELAKNAESQTNISLQYPANCDCPSCVSRKYDASKYADFPPCGLLPKNVFVPLMQKGVQIINPVTIPLGMSADFYARQVTANSDTEMEDWVNMSLVQNMAENIANDAAISRATQARVRLLDGAYFYNQYTHKKIHGVRLLELLSDYLSDCTVTNNIFVFDEDMKGFAVRY